MWSQLIWRGVSPTVSSHGIIFIAKFHEKLGLKRENLIMYEILLIFYKIILQHSKSTITMSFLHSECRMQYEAHV